MKLALDARLTTIAQMVRQGARIADIGCDHGYLICHLIQSGQCPSGMACDINAQPLDKARATAQQCGLLEKIEFHQCDGLGAITPARVDDIVIAGMGGDLIAKILIDAPWTKDKDKRYVLQPMTKPERLRQILGQEGFAIETELAVSAGKFVYPVLSVYYLGEQQSDDPLFWYMGRLNPAHGADEMRYLERVLGELRIKSKGAVQAGDVEKAQWYGKLADRLETIISGKEASPFLPL